MYALIFAVVILVIVCCYASVHYSEYGRTINKFPGPAPMPILGNSWNFATCSFSDTYYKLQSFQDTYYPVVRLWAFMSEAVLFVRDPDDIKTILTSRVNLDKSVVAYEPVRRACNNNGILFSHAKTWKVRRRMLNNAFTPNLIKLYSRISDEHTVEFIEQLKGKSDIDNVTEFYHQLVLSSTSEAMMGVKLANLNQDLTKRYV
ncbi:cytochrome P450 4e3-like [Trichogramma pretiosum]|uniref:cytochrome P450 4e3-like n=1 Tax=Trichogramma pretiosum TaxID=7493 RepID=UPI000C71AB4A|nr:cytochrome P450 4e3-like [Trichogramma pretiosum]